MLIKQAKNVDKTAGGVLLASSSESEKPNFGTVVAVGDGKKKEDSEEIVQPSVKVGSTVMYSKYAGTEYTDSDETEYIVVREQEILASLA